ncbi:MAG: ABC transporter ATP-binding protein [Anaerolineae bacterium]
MTGLASGVDRERDGAGRADILRVLDPRLRTARALLRAARLLWQSAPGWAAVGLGLVAVQSVLPPLALYCTKVLVDAVAAGSAETGRLLGPALLPAGALGAIALLGSLCRSLAAVVNEAQAQAATDRVQSLIQAKSVQLELAYYEDVHYNDTLHRAQQDATYRPALIANGLVQVLQSGLTLALLAGYLVSLQPGLALVLFAAALPAALIRIRYSGLIYAWQRKNTRDERLAWYYHALLTVEAAAKEVRLFDLGQLFMSRFRHVRQRLRDERIRIARRRFFADAAAQGSGTVLLFAAYGLMVYEAVAGRITLGSLVMYYQALQRGQDLTGALLSSLAGLYEHSLFLANLYEFLDLPLRTPCPAQPDAPAPEPGLVCRHVSFSYTAHSGKALDDVCLSIRPGEHVALVGENGSGKTTLAKLLCRLYDPTEGCISLDGTDLRCLDEAALHRGMSVVFQDYARYHLTARENIWLGDKTLPQDDARIVEAARAAGADELITALPQGYDTVLSNWLEDGKDLSLGQWQRVALARAFLRDAPIIILDEPASALDAKAEWEILGRFSRLAVGRTTVVISHRFSTVRQADRIVVMEKGRITEQGTHSELMQQGGTYAHMFALQASHYQ